MLSWTRSAGFTDILSRSVARRAAQGPVTPSSRAFASALFRVSRASPYSGSALSASAARYSFRCSALRPGGNGLVAMAWPSSICASPSWANAHTAGSACRMATVSSALRFTVWSKAILRFSVAISGGLISCLRKLSNAPVPRAKCASAAAARASSGNFSRPFGPTDR